MKCYIGPCGVLVPTGTVHSRNEFEFEFIYARYMDLTFMIYMVITFKDYEKVACVAYHAI